MPDRSHLTAVATTDKRGRSTTVYRNLGRPVPGGRAALPAAVIAAPPAPAAQSSAGPFREPTKRTRAAMGEFLKSIGNWWPGITNPSNRVLRTPGGRCATALAMDLIDEGILEPAEALWLTVVSHPEDGTATAEDALRVASVLAPRAEELQGDGSSWFVRVGMAVRGNRSEANALGRSPIRTQRDLDACLARTAFVLRLSGDRQVVTTMRARRRGDIDETYYVVNNRDLSELIRERPEDVDRIITHVEEHGVEPRSAEDVHMIRVSLDSDAPAALQRGWL